MRTIKFRAFHKKEKKMCEVYTINFVDGYISLKGGRMLDHLRNIELMQFTGLKSKSGKEIFEGDIVKLVNEPEEKDAEHMQGVGVVGWDDNNLRFGWSEKIGGRPFHMLTWGGTKSIEIIGNRFENPELLNEKT